jgi:hypothetical protein
MAIGLHTQFQRVEVREDDIVGTGYDKLSLRCSRWHGKEMRVQGYVYPRASAVYVSI